VADRRPRATSRILIGVVSQTFSVPCPSCAGPIQFHPVDNLQVGICEACGGAWFGSGQLDSLVKHGPIALDQLVSLEPVGSHSAHRGGNAACPACNIPLRSSAYAGIAPVHISACYQCGGMFIDAASIEALDANANHRAISGGGAFGQHGSFASTSEVPAPQAKIHSISNNLFRRNQPGYFDYDDYSAGDQTLNTLVAVDIAADLLSMFL
jgi:Zn-finger nucleic acid-binding protein